MPRAALVRRFGEAVARRLDQAEGDLPEPLSPLGETPERRVRLGFAEPIADPADLAHATERLAADLMRRLAREGMGARRLELAFYRVDGRVEHIAHRHRAPEPRSASPRRASLMRARHRRSRPRRRGHDPRRLCRSKPLAARADRPLPARPEAGGDRARAAPRPARQRLGLARSTGSNRAKAISPSGPRSACQPRRRRPSRSGRAGHLTPALPTAAAGPAARAAGAGRGRLAAARRPAGPLSLAPASRIGSARRRAGAHRRGMVARRGAGCRRAIRDYYRVEDEDGRRFWLFRAGLYRARPRRRAGSCTGVFACHDRLRRAAGHQQFLLPARRLASRTSWWRRPRRSASPRSRITDRNSAGRRGARPSGGQGGRPPPHRRRAGSIFSDGTSLLCLSRRPRRLWPADAAC